MENVSTDSTVNLASQLTELVAPIQGAGSLLQTLAKKLSATLGISSAAGATTGNAADNGIGGTSGFAEGLLGGVDGQFGGILSKLFGTGTEEEGDAATDTAGDAAGDGSAESADKIKSANGDVVDDQKKQDGERVKSDAKAWGAIVGNALASSKKLRKIKKAAAIGSVIIDTAKGIAKTFADLGFPAGVVPAAQLALSGAAQIKAIKGQAHDGIKSIPSTGTYLLERGERVVDSRLNTDLSGFLNAQNGAARTSNTVTSDNRSSSVTNAPVINLSIGSDADENAVSSNRGAAETMIREIFADYAMDAPFG